ncbi:hypothetical protein E2C01_039515 [Portunus trituberculatus]|uniref:Uncharacterized protein n=1 Tax=Portunus trituberculatus TaxID=210409 RepID=A0A5B7FDV0_PORTR|nr:hypothetical protein [Portunus trituberculatus]
MWNTFKGREEGRQRGREGVKEGRGKGGWEVDGVWCLGFRVPGSGARGADASKVTAGAATITGTSCVMARIISGRIRIPAKGRQRRRLPLAAAGITVRGFAS